MGINSGASFRCFLPAIKCRSGVALAGGTESRPDHRRPQRSTGPRGGWDCPVTTRGEGVTEGSPAQSHLLFEPVPPPREGAGGGGPGGAGQDPNQVSERGQESQSHWSARAPRNVCVHIILLSQKEQEFRLSERMKEGHLKPPRVKERAQNPADKKAALKGQRSIADIPGPLMGSVGQQRGRGSS